MFISNLRHLTRGGLLVAALVLSALSACAPATIPSPVATTAGTTAGANLVVFAAASLTDAFSDIGKTFEAAHPGTKVTFSFAGSNQLRQQIEEGARVDVFASANTKEMETLVKGGNVAAGTSQPFVHNRLTIIVPKDNPA